MKDELPDLFAEFNEDGSFAGYASEFADLLEEPVPLFRRPPNQAVRKLEEACRLLIVYDDTADGASMDGYFKAVKAARSALAAVKEQGK